MCPALAARLRGEEEKPLDKDLELGGGANGLDYTRHTSLLSSHASSIYIDYDMDPDLLEKATELGAAGGVSHIISPVPSCPCPSPAASTASLPALDPHAVEAPVLMVEEAPQQEEEQQQQQPPATPRAEHEAAEAKAAADDERFFSRHRSAPTVCIAAAGDDAAFAAAAAEREREVEMDWRPTYGDFTDVDLGGCWDGPAPAGRRQQRDMMERAAAGGVPPPSPQQPYMQVAAPVQQQQPKLAKEEPRPAAPPAPAAFAEESAWQRRRRQQHRGRSRSFSSSRKALGLPARPLEPSQ